MVCSGISCMRDGDVTEGEVEVDHADLDAGLRASATPRLTAIVVLPTPPLGEKTVNTWPLRSPSATPVGPWIASQVLRARVTAVPRAGLVVGGHDGADAGLHRLGVDLRARARGGSARRWCAGCPARTRSASAAAAAHVERGTDHHGVLAAAVEPAVDLVGAGDDLRAARQRRA